MHWKGPFEVISKVGTSDYRLDVNGKVRTYHANLLKRYVVRNEASKDEEFVEKRFEAGTLATVCVGVIEPEIKFGSEEGKSAVDSENLIDLPCTEARETIADVNIDSNLTIEQQEMVREILHEFRDVLSEVPGQTNLVEHDIQLTTNEPLRSKPYPLPFALREEVSKEVKSMLEMGIIEKCDSPYASPVVMVRKSDNNFRLCVDYRKVNKAVVFDAEPMPNPDEIFTKLSKSKYFTKIDLSKGYFQLPLKKSCRKITAFVTHEGLFCFKRLPFGLVTGGASFSRMMRILLDGMKDAENFIDDILLHSVTWDDHVRALRELLTRLRNARLTARPSKCMIGYLQLDFLGHVVGNNQLKPNELKIQAIADAKRPESKKQLQ